ncbi:MAG TPA: Lpg1974 family pore-forming outer membrane protein [Pirellulales bacterium]|jgi:hypothetical protein|nr:Lpg1974 family pore-forming outer membrane protein [Pirellulales bacterium]
MSIYLRAALLAAFALTANLSWGQSTSKTLSYESPKPRAEAVSYDSTGSSRVTPAAYSDTAAPAAPTPDKAVGAAAPAVMPAEKSLAEASQDTNWDDSYFYGHRDGAWFGGAEYLLLRTHLSQDTAYLRLDEPNLNPPVFSTSTAINYNWDYASGIRAFVGYRLCDCGGELEFTYFGFNDTASAASATGTSTVMFTAPNDLSPSNGQTLFASASINLNTFDIDVSKRIPLGNCNCCCPEWDLKWSAGVRIADVRQSKDRYFSDPNTGVVRLTDYTTRFTGAGPRLGLEGRRYFGDCGNLSLFARGFGSLLLGDFDSRRTITTTAIPEVDSSIQDQTRIIPVAEIEVGGSWQLSERLLLTGGYLFQAWWDLGQSEIYTRTGNGFDTALDSNILSFDGFFVRAEYTF